VGFIDFDPVKSILGLVITPIPFLIMAMFQEGSIGGGDVKLVGACGFAWGALDCIFISIIGNLFAIIVAILYQCKYKKMKQTSYPYVPLWLIGWLLLIVT
jgi:leader peptidase (prepilin peptidase)/N-methyltransferase